MKYGQLLSTNLTPEWRIKYIDYKKLKKLIENFSQEKEEYELNHPEVYKLKKEEFETDFLNEIDKELKKVEKFYEDQISEDQIILENLKVNWKAVKRQNDKKIQMRREKHLEMLAKKNPKNKRKLPALKRRRSVADKAGAAAHNAASIVKRQATETFHTITNNITHSKFFHHTFNALHLTHKTILEKNQKNAASNYRNGCKRRNSGTFWNRKRSTRRFTTDCLFITGKLAK